MSVFGFWNLKKLEASSLVAEFVDKEGVDFFFCCEGQRLDQRFLVQKMIQKNKGGSLFEVTSPGLQDPGIRAFTRYPKLIVPIADTTRMRCFKISLPCIPVFIAAVVHGPTLRGTSRKNVDDAMSRLSRDLEFQKLNLGVNHSLVLGDFNSNPYDRGIVSAEGFHAIPDGAEVESRGERMIDGEKYSYHYNPMWNFLGDKTAGPPGTLYYRESGSFQQQWHLFDQVMLSRGLLSHFDLDSVRIAECKYLDLIRPNGRIRGNRKNDKPDHLPIILESFT